LEGVQLFEKLHPDLVLLDMMMPQYDGLYALREIRKKDATANIVIITGGYPDSIEDELQSLNPTKILFKPFDVDALTELFSIISHNQPLLKIKYKFKEDDKYYTCMLSYEQYQNFKELQVIQECDIIEKYEKQTEYNLSDMEKALNLAAKNDTSHIRKLSVNV